jgi:hypothetical protein
MKRVLIPELLDTDAGTPAEVKASLDDLRRINRWFGGVSTTTDMVRIAAREIQATSMTLLEVAAGSGYVPDTVRKNLKKEDVTLHITLLDRSSSHLNGNDRTVAGDALALPFQDASFDMVSCNLFAHHLDAGEFVTFAQEALRVCRVAALINDLIRDPVHLALVYAGLPLYRSRLTRHDAPASVRQAYTLQEMRAMLANTSAARVEILRYYLYRMGVIAWKHKS